MCCVKTRTLFIIIGVFYFSEGKTCPEKTRPHRTRCEMFYECMELSTEKHVWIPKNCAKGLVYVRNLDICALPGDDWECTLGDVQILQLSDKNDQIYDPNRNHVGEVYNSYPNKHSDIYIVPNETQESNFVEHPDDVGVEVILKSSFGDERESDDDVDLHESSGDGIDFSDGFLQVEDKEAMDDTHEANDTYMPIKNTGAPIEAASKPNVDPSLTAHLQHLSQLIDGLKKKYQNRDKGEADLTPDQLNAFLAHFNIKNKFDTLTLDQTNHDQFVVKPTTPVPTVFNSVGKEKNVAKLNKGNKTNLFHLSRNKLRPEAKVVLSSSLPKRYNPLGFSNSQVVVNRPEGSVLFSLPPYSSDGNFIAHLNNYDRNSPKISEETLKTVLELSKQMIENQNVPKVIPNPTYYAQPIIQPLFLPPSSSISDPFSPYFNSPINTNSEYSYGSASIFNGNKPLKGYTKLERPQHNFNGRPGTTIIHNNVIPVHVASTSSGEKEIIDSYGQSLGLYPPLGVGNDGNSNKDYTFHVTHRYENNKFVTTVKPYISTTSSSQYASGQFPPPYESAVTTVRPPLELQPAPSTVAQYYKPSPYLSENNVNSIFQSPDRYSSMQYANFPSSTNSNHPGPNQGTYQQLERPSSHKGSNRPSPFTGLIDIDKVSIYPNAEKFESMETEDHLISLNKFGHSSHQQPSSSQGQPPNLNKNSYLPRPQSMYGNEFAQVPNKPKYSAFGDPSQLVNIGGNFISYDVFQNTILPLIGQPTGIANSDFGNLEIISCQAGVRQPNVTDCKRYYVCSKKDGKVLSYTCPPYTAFNGQTRICDARTYAVCVPDAVLSSYTVSENKRIQLEAMQALNEANRRRAEALKAQNLANFVNKYSSELNAQPPAASQNNVAPQNTDAKDPLDAYFQQAASLSASASIPSTTSKPQKKRKYYCKEGDKVADQTSIYNYFVCYKNADGIMKGHKMSCSKNLLFCPMTSVCTLPAKCV